MEARQVLEPLEPDSLRRLHRGAAEDSGEISRILDRLRRERVLLRNGVSRASAPRTAHVIEVADDSVVLAARHISCNNQPQIYLAFQLDGAQHFFAARPISGGGPDPLIIGMPEAIYEAERRDLHRDNQAWAASPARVELRGSGGVVNASVTDWSYQGLGLSLDAADAMEPGSSLEITFLDGARRGERSYATVRHSEIDRDRPWCVRIGVAVSNVARKARIAVERRKAILPGAPTQQAWRRVALATAIARSMPARVVDRVRSRRVSQEHVELVKYSNKAGGVLNAIVNRTGNPVGAPVIVIPPAWGKTKETLVALAVTLVETFARAGRPLVVIRFDGTNRRGESHIDPEFSRVGDEYLGFKFSQAVVDIEATLDFLQDSEAFRSTSFLLVSYSLGSVETRRAVARDTDGRVIGWVSVVGMADLQSGLRTVSGGVDYAYGLGRGVSFGRHELVGVVADMDLTGADALQHGLVFAEDARRDMAKINVPVTWIHGRYDAWMELTRVRELLSAGPTERRRLIEVSTGHQMRNSREALETFQLVAQEASSMICGERLPLAPLNLTELQRVATAERSRIIPTEIDLRSFWRDYLLGRDRRLGIELMTSTTAYRELMALQIDRLQLTEGARVIDLGAGTGAFPVLLPEVLPSLKEMCIIELDYIHEALQRGTGRAKEAWGPRRGLTILSIVADLDSKSGAGLPVADGTADAVIASLLLTYLSDPSRLLQQARSALRPGGRIVLSSLRLDADISRIYVEGVAELPPDRVREHFGENASRDFELLQRRFLNDAARLVDLEEAGHFRFWDEAELEELVRKAGFEDVATERAFGDPAQALVVSARRP